MKRRYGMTAYFLNRSRRAQYDLMGALRGPDWARDHAGFQFIKGEIVGRVRCIIWGAHNKIPKACWESRPLSPSTLRGMTGAAHAVRATIPHFIDHLVAAIKASRSHRVWGGQAEAIIKVLRGTT